MLQPLFVSLMNMISYDWSLTYCCHTCSVMFIIRISSYQLTSIIYSVYSVLEFALFPYMVQCPQSEEEHSVATFCGFGDESHDLRVKTC